VDPTASQEVNRADVIDQKGRDVVKLLSNGIKSTLDSFFTTASSLGIGAAKCRYAI
jgi:hypothetical protein